MEIKFLNSCRSKNLFSRGKSVKWKYGYHSNSFTAARRLVTWWSARHDGHGSHDGHDEYGRHGRYDSYGSHTGHKEYDRDGRHIRHVGYDGYDRTKWRIDVQRLVKLQNV